MRRRVSDDGAGRDGAADLLRRRESEDQTRDRGPRARQRAGMDRPGMDGIGSSDRTRPVPVHRVQRPELGCPEVQLRFRHRARRGRRRRHHQCARSESEAVHRSRRQADSVSRLERSADLAGNSTQYYTRVLEALGGAARIAEFVSAVHGAGHGALRRWRRTEHIRHGQRARAMGRTRQGRPIRSLRHTRPNGVVDRTRPLCPYPQVAVYKGTGSPDEAANFECKAR